MKFNSTSRNCPPVSLRQAVLGGLAPDGGLFMPESLPLMPAEFLRRLPGLKFNEIALAVSERLLGEDLPAETLRHIIENRLDFDAPLLSLSDGLHVLELFHGPTLAFKDFGARFMAGLMGYFVQSETRELVILVATSGDTGGAVAAGFYRTPGVRVVILFPSGKVSAIQEKQLTTFGENICALEISGTFDDCQRLVKTAFADTALTSRIFLSSANSINIARLIPQSFYYFNAAARLAERLGPAAAAQAVFSVPSGNFGNLTAGLIAKRMGLPAAGFVAATNVNSAVPEYLRSGEYRPRPSRATISNAMDVGAPSNFARMQALYGSSLAGLQADLEGFSFSDAETVRAIKAAFDEHNYIFDPHGAVGLLGLQAWKAKRGAANPGIVLATAHPAKFKETVENATGSTLALPPALAGSMSKTGEAGQLPPEYEALRSFLLSGYG